MARSISSAKLLTALVVDGVSNSFRRGYAAPAVTSQEAVTILGRGEGSNKMASKSTEEVVGSTEKMSWVPDPVTGYYRPENRAAEIDMAELRASEQPSSNTKIS